MNSIAMAFGLTALFFLYMITLGTFVIFLLAIPFQIYKITKENEKSPAQDRHSDNIDDL